MRSNERLHRVLEIRQLGGRRSVATACSAVETSIIAGDLKLFALTFAGGFLFTSIFIA